ncbi:MAG: T9SS type A sorting domain-containing protein [candidate division WOR-3 bacterium]
MFTQQKVMLLGVGIVIVFGGYINGANAGISEPREINESQSRWGPDRIIYQGYIQGPYGYGGEYEPISVDHVRGETLRAAVADRIYHTLYVLQSNDNGKTWNYLIGWTFPSNESPYNPGIINDPWGRWYHVFCLVTNNVDNIYLIVFTDSTPGGWYSTVIDPGAPDTLLTYAVCSSRCENLNPYTPYWLFCVYWVRHEGYSVARLKRSNTFGATWETLWNIVSGEYPDITYGDNGWLYVLERWHNPTTGKYGINLERSPNYGNNWLFPAVKVVDQSDWPINAPKIAAAHDGSGDLWVVFPMKDLGTGLWGIYYSWSQDNGSTWSSIAQVATPAFHHLYPSIAVYDLLGYRAPYLSFVGYGSSFKYIYSTYWQANNTWAPVFTNNDFSAGLCYPVQTWDWEGGSGIFSAIAYVGEYVTGSGYHNAYFDSWSFNIEEDNKNTINKSTLSIHPNPFLENAVVEYSVPKSGRVILKVYNILGQEIAKLVDEHQEAGNHSILINRKDLMKGNVSSGIYFLRLMVNGITVTGKATIR